MCEQKHNKTTNKTTIVTWQFCSDYDTYLCPHEYAKLNSQSAPVTGQSRLFATLLLLQQPPRDGATYLYTVAVSTHQRGLLNADVDAHSHVFVGVLCRADAAFCAAHVVLVGVVGQRRVAPQHREGDISLEDVKVPRDDARFLGHLHKHLQAEHPCHITSPHLLQETWEPFH